MVRGAHFLCLNVNDSYNYNNNMVDLSDQLRNVYQVDHWTIKYKWWWSLLSRGHGIVPVNYYIHYKTLCEEGKVKAMSHYEFQRLVCLAKTDPECFGGRIHLV